MRAGDYARYKYENCIYIGKIKFISEVMGFEETLQLNIDDCMEEILKEDVIKSSPNITDLLHPMDLIYVDVDNNYAGGIIVPRIAETQAELNIMIDLIKSGQWILKGVVTNEQLDNIRYKVGK